MVLPQLSDDLIRHVIEQMPSTQSTTAASILVTCSQLNKIWLALSREDVLWESLCKARWTEAGVPVRQVASGTPAVPCHRTFYAARHSIEAGRMPTSTVGAPQAEDDDDFHAWRRDLFVLLRTFTTPLREDGSPLEGSDIPFAIWSGCLHDSALFDDEDDDEEDVGGSWSLSLPTSCYASFFAHPDASTYEVLLWSCGAQKMTVLVPPGSEPAGATHNRDLTILEYDTTPLTDDGWSVTEMLDGMAVDHRRRFLPDELADYMFLDPPSRRCRERLKAQQMSIAINVSIEYETTPLEHATEDEDDLLARGQVLRSRNGFSPVAADDAEDDDEDDDEDGDEEDVDDAYVVSDGALFLRLGLTRRVRITGTLRTLDSPEWVGTSPGLWPVLLHELRWL